MGTDQLERKYGAEHVLKIVAKDECRFSRM